MASDLSDKCRTSKHGSISRHDDVPIDLTWPAVDRAWWGHESRGRARAHETKVVWCTGVGAPTLPTVIASLSSAVHVLIVDDDESLRRALARAIRRAGHDVESYASVEALMAHGVPARDACLVLDLELPGTGGANFKRMLVASGHDMPTVFITAWDAVEARDALAGLVPSPILHKPFQNEALLDAIGRACRHA